MHGFSWRAFAGVGRAVNPLQHFAVEVGAQFFFGQGHGTATVPDLADITVAAFLKRVCVCVCAVRPLYSSCMQRGDEFRRAC